RADRRARAWRGPARGGAAAHRTAPLGARAGDGPCAGRRRPRFVYEMSPLAPPSSPATGGRSRTHRSHSGHRILAAPLSRGMTVRILLSVIAALARCAAYLNALLIWLTRFVCSQENPPSFSGARPKWP